MHHYPVVKNYMYNVSEPEGTAGSENASYRVAQLGSTGEHLAHEVAMAQDVQPAEREPGHLARVQQVQRDAEASGQSVKDIQFKNT